MAEPHPSSSPSPKRRHALWLVLVHLGAGAVTLAVVAKFGWAAGAPVLLLSTVLLAVLALRGPHLTTSERLREQDRRAERRRITSALEQSRRMLEGAERLADIGSWSYDPATGEVRWSDHLFEICGLEPGAIEPSLEVVCSAMHRDDVDRFLRALRRAARGEGTLEQEARVFLPTGEMRYHFAKAEPVLDDDGDVVLVLGATRDVTRRRRAELTRRELELQVQQLQKLEAIGTLAGGIAHDFNNILGAAIGFTDMALDELPEDHPAHAYLREIERANLRAKDLVSQILAYSQKVERHRRPVDLCAVVREALGLMRASLPASITVEDELEAERAVVTADGSQLHQVLVNLCTNAAQAMPDGGRLRLGLATEHHEAAFDTATFRLPPGDYFRLSVSDTGCGMDRDTRRHIFDPFFTTKPEGVGTGLGLSTVSGIVLDHHGGIGVHSEPGVGTTFEIYLPCAGDDADDEEPAPTDTPVGQREVVMLIDDERPLVTLGERMLEQLGYRAMAFQDAREALEAFRQMPEHVDLVITDLRMPEMSGIDLALEMRRLAPEIPIVVTTGFEDRRLDEQLAAGTVQEVLPKPFKLTAIGGCVARALGRARGDGEADAGVGVGFDAVSTPPPSV